MTFDVFISYASVDKPVADAACAALESADIRCWMAPRDVSPGRDYGEAIIDAIEAARIFVLILSSNANASSQIKREVERAVSKGLIVMPVRIEDVAPSRNLEYFISSPHWLDAFPPPRDEYFTKLVESVQALLGAGPTRPAVATPVAVLARKQPRKRLGLLVGAVAAVVVGGGGYALYRLQSQSLVRTLTGHGADADSVSFSPDGKLLAAGGWDQSIQIWTVADGLLQSPGISGFQGHAAPFAPDGRTIAGGGQLGNNVLVWDAVSHRVLQTFSGHTGLVQTVAFSYDGKSLASGGNDHLVYFWDATGAQPRRQFAGHTDEVYSVAFSTNNKWIASASFDRTVIVWDVAGGQALKTLTGTNKMNAAVFSSDDGWLATAGWDGNITVWDTGSWQVIRVFPGDGQIVTSVAFSRDNKLIVSGGYDNTVKIWDTATGALRRTFTGHAAPVWSVGFSPDGKTIASASSDKTVKIWKTP